MCCSGYHRTMVYFCTGNRGITFVMSVLVSLYISICMADDPWNELGDSTYFISDQPDINLKLTYAEASLHCQNQNAQLASVHSQNETEFLVKSRAADHREYWFGLHHVDPDLTAQCHCDRICPNIDASTSSTPSTTCADCDLCRGADKWQWEDGTLYDFTNWHTTQPSNFNTEKCARFHGDGKWYDNICSDRLYFICKKDLQALIVTFQDDSVRSTTTTQVPHDKASTQSTQSTSKQDSSTSPDTNTDSMSPAGTVTPQETVKKEDDNTAMIIGVVVAVAVVIIVVIVIGVILVFRKKRKGPKHDYVNTEEYAQAGVIGSGGKTIPMSNGIGGGYDDPDIDEELDEMAYATSNDVTQEDQNNPFAHTESDLYNQGLTPESENDGLPVYAEVDKTTKKKNQGKPEKPPRAKKKKKGQAPLPPDTADGMAMYAVPSKGKKTKTNGVNNEQDGHGDVAMMYAEPKKKPKVKAGKQEKPSVVVDTEYQDVDNVQTNPKKPVPKPKPRSP